MEVIYDIDN